VIQESHLAPSTSGNRHSVTSNGYPYREGRVTEGARASALELQARQQTQVCVAIYQNHLALDYLLAEEGGYLTNSTIQTTAFKLMTMDKQ
jgi:hypothetical protein